MSSAFVINQIGCVVPDLGKAIEGWVQLGVGPFLELHDAAIGDHVYRGSPSKPKVSAAFGQNGDLQIELIQPVNDDPSSYGDFLAQGRSGLQHVGWFCEDYEGALAAAAKEGRRELEHGEFAGVRFCYYEPGAGNGVISELIELNDVSREMFALIRQEAEQWDGTEPQRSLVREAGWGLRWDAAKGELSHLFGR